MKNIKFILTQFITSILTLGVYAQSVTIDPSSSSALINTKSSSQGFLMPRITASERLTILDPAVGLQVYQTDGITGIYYFSISGWNLVGASTGVNNAWQLNGNEIFNINSGNVGIGTQTPIAPLTVFRATNSAKTQYQTNNTGILQNDGFFTGIFDLGMSAYAMNYENAPLVLGTNGISRIKIDGAGNVGIGTVSPTATLNVMEGKTVIFGGDSTTDNKNKLIWYGNKGALRAGKASVLGFNYEGVGINSIAMGHFTNAKGNYSTAFGDLTYAFGTASTAMGSGSTANDYATAIGNDANATGLNSTALGNNSDTNNKTNSFCIAGSTLGASNTAAYQMMMRFDNYTFMLGNSGNYVYLLSASNGWNYVSDKNRKENFKELNGETVLKKISNIPFYSWNFKAKESREYRHYGIMAQDFHEYFGKDELGVIGNDTTVSALDLLGVAYAAIKALEKRTEDLQIKNNQLMGMLNSQNKKLAVELADLKAMVVSGKKKTDNRK